MTELTQNRLFIKRTIIIGETKVSYRTSKFGKETEISIPYEDITANKESYSLQYKDIWIVILVIFLLAFFSFIWRNDKDFHSDIWIIWTILLISAFLFHFTYAEKVWKLKLQNYTYIFINKKMPDENTVNTFIDNLFETRRKYLKEIYFHTNKNMSYEEQFKKLQWLRKNEVLSETEFQEKLKELNSLFNTQNKNIGF